MPSIETFRQSLEREQTVELLASIEHQRWADWQQYVHDHCERREDGSLVLPAELVSRWDSQIHTPYSDLTDDEKKSDREQVLRYLPTIIGLLDRL